MLAQKPGELSSRTANNVSLCSSTLSSVVDSAKGSIIRDIDGNEYIDLVAGIAVMNAGHSNPEVEAAISAQLKKMTHCGYGDFLPSLR